MTRVFTSFVINASVKEFSLKILLFGRKFKIPLHGN
jgi:hypothetical protein